MLYDSFFYNTVSQTDRNEGIRAKAWPMAMDLAKQVEPHLKVVRVHQTYKDPYASTTNSAANNKLILGDAETGWPIAQVFYDTSESQYVITNWNRPLRKRGRSRYSLKGKTAGYVKRALGNAVTGGIAAMHKHIPDYINQELRQVMLYLQQSVAGELYKKSKVSQHQVSWGIHNLAGEFTQEINEWLVRCALGEVTPAEIPSNNIAVVASAWKSYKKTFEVKQEVEKTTKEIITPVKWVVGCSSYEGHQLGYFIGSIKFDPESKTEAQAHNIKLYKTVQDYVETNPELGKQLMAAYSFMHRFWEKPEFKDMDFCDPAYRYVPKGDNLWGETGACSYYKEYNSPASPQWLLMDKLPCT